MTNEYGRLAWLLATAATGTALLCGPQAAAAPQQQGVAAPSGGQGANQAQVSEVIVTAQKRSEALLSVPTPVTAVQAADLAKRGDVKLTDYAAAVPGLNVIAAQAGQTVVIMRGVSTGFGAGIPSTTATYIDDTPYGSSTSAAYGSIGTLDLDPATLARIEVLRGPQGTLYGASSLGGLIKYVTRPPSLSDDSGRVEVSGSKVDGGGSGYGLRGMFDGPIVQDKLGITISAFGRRDPGYINDPHQQKKNVNRSDVVGGRIALLWKPTENFSAELSSLAQDSFTPGTSNVDVDSNLNPIFGKYEHVRFGNEKWNFKNRLYSLDLNYDLGWASLTSISSYATRKAKWYIEESYKFGPTVSRILGGVPNLGLFDQVTLDMNKETQEFRLASPDNVKLEWLGGIFFTHERSVKPEAFTQPISTITDLPIPEAAQPNGLYSDILHDSYTEYAAYGDLTYHLTSKFKITGGLRFAHNSEKDVIPSDGLLNGGASVASGNSSDHSLTYLVTPSYNLNDNNMVYARIASGYRPGGPTNVGPASIQAGAPSSYKPDSLTNYEVGYKGSFPDHRMTVDLSAFHINWKNIQLLTQINGFNVTGNAGTAQSDGLEFAWTWAPLDGLSVSADGAYTNARLTSDAPLVGGKSGDALPDVPKFSANVGAEYDFALTSDVDGFVGGNYQYMGARPIDFVSGAPAGYERPLMPKFSEVNLRAGAYRGGLSLEFYIKNVGNSYGMTRLVSLLKNGYGAPLAAAIIQPRTFGLSISKRF